MGSPAPGTLEGVIMPVEFHRSIEQLKKDAKREARAQGLTHSQALRLIAARYGYTSWEACQEAVKLSRVLDYLDKATVIDIARLAHRSRAAEAEEARRKPDGWMTLQRSKAYRMLFQRVNALSFAERGELFALMSLGRGDDDVEDWAAIRARAVRDKDPGMTGYLCGKAPLGDYLRDGLYALAQAESSCRER